MHVAIFGSTARGASDEYSDYDIILVLNDEELKYKDQKIKKIKTILPKNASISVYSNKRYFQLLACGSPFAWHVYLEHIPFFAYSNDLFKLSPADYVNSLRDIQGMALILKSSIEAIEKNSNSLIYEAGIHYVCARNIAMFASKKICNKFDFSRYSPYCFGDILKFPLSRSDYDLIMRCRLSSARGIIAPKIEKEHIYETGKMIDKWTKGLIQYLSGKESYV